MKKRKFGAPAARSIVAPWPLMVIPLAIGGRPFGPYQLLSISVRVIVAPAGKTISSSTRVLLAMQMASRNVRLAIPPAIAANLAPPPGKHSA